MQEQASLLQMGIRKRCETSTACSWAPAPPACGARPQSAGPVVGLFPEFPERSPCAGTGPVLSSRTWAPSAARSSVHVCSHPPVVTPRRTPERPASGFLRIHWKPQPVIQNLEACMRGVLGAGVRGKALQSMRLTDVLIAGAFEL